MDGPRFDAWTRRRFGLATGLGLAVLIGAAAPFGIDAKRKKKRCKRLGDTCTSGGKRKCCHDLRCDHVGLDSIIQTFCCHTEGKSCSKETDCCTGLGCSGDLCRPPTSDRALKANFGSVDPADMLRRVGDLPISTWNYTSDDPAVRHIGPMAQDFAARFGTGADDRHIHPLDGQGVALAAIQGLSAELERLRSVNAALAARIVALEEAGS